ncbi:MAG: ATP-binding protein [Thaumarchaeota archaeon]|jgi:predicted ATPase|nr:ATP-binding protein [Candidatus Geocrenenecus arthurdayi]MCL7390324.1 ATP-binding protein [Candidatus Geocrenenecus arthurdayi]MCL7391933.1 ATP-binding protein [Candidatus Geocrenenecus arthurdayi]MCL7397337.1 ATP-binding protein [Candidatus Geocrenenecus arthurdayi]MCL7402196.1 ATP-binding protein [Candidatus Geocrenenecus arthurdayi]
MKINIENFKSIEKLALDLAPLTILIGPPAGGKSNILDAIMLTGYFNRIRLVEKEYASYIGLEPIKYVIRFEKSKELFYRYDPTRLIKIEYLDGDEVFSYQIYFEGGTLRQRIQTPRYIPTYLSWNMLEYGEKMLGRLVKELERLRLFDARLYSYDRFSLSSRECESDFTCGFYARLQGLHAKDYPFNVLSEFAWNALSICRQAGDLIDNLNSLLQQYVGERFQLSITRYGVVLLDNYIDVELTSVSDAVFRALYYLLGLRSAKTYTKLYGLEGRMFLLFEEPEAHIFPYFLNLLVDAIEDAVSLMNIVIATHNPILVSLLWDRVPDLKIYYVYRERAGGTKAVEIDKEKFAQELKLVDDLMFMTAQEILDKYAIRSEEVEH